MKRTLSLVLALVMVLGTFTSVFAAEQSVEAKAGAFLKEVEVLAGNTEGDLMLSENLERRDQVILLSKLMKEFETAKEFPTSEESPTWKDNGDKFYTPFLAWAQANEHFSGHSTTKFGPREAITAQDYAAVLLRVLGHDAKETYADSLKLAKELGILADVATLENSTKITRGQMAVMTVNALDVTIKDSTITLAEKLGIKMPAPATLEVVNVSATNLKQIEVEFNNKVDEASAVKLDNYTFDKAFEMAELQEDGRTVVLTLKNDDAVKFDNQKEYKLTVNNVENAAKTLKLAKVEKKFVAIDNTIPTVKEVIGLGTKAIKVVFSEPVKAASANSTLRYKIDGKMVAGYVKYVYPNEVIITTSVTVGDHELAVTGVEDFAKFSVQEPGVKFTVVEDTTAPEIVSAKTVDLDKVVVTFNEPVKAIASASHTSKSNGAKSITIEGNKATIVFNNKMSLADTTIFVNDVQDYSDNKTDRTILITPELDLTRPEVVEVKVTKEATGTNFAVKFNKEVENTVSGNYVIKKADGTLVNTNGLYKGNPLVSMRPSADKKTNEFTLAGHLPMGSYTLEVVGVRDTATIGNIIMPHIESFVIGDTKAPSVSKAWIEDGKSIYVQFDEDMALEGNGSILDVVKYSYSSSVGSNVYIPMPVGTTVDLITTNTIRLNLVKVNGSYPIPAAIRVVLVTDLAGNWISQNDSLMGGKDLADNKVTVTNVEAIAKDTLEVTFDSKLVNIDQNDFAVGDATYTNLAYNTHTYDGNKTIATFKIVGDDHKLTNAQNPGTFYVKADPKSYDEFGSKVALISGGKSIVDAIKPSVSKENKAVLAGNTITVKFDEQLATVVNAHGVISVNAEDADGKAISVTGINNGSANELVITLSGVPVTANRAITVTLNEDLNKSVKAISDLEGNAPKAFVVTFINGTLVTE